MKSAAENVEKRVADCYSTWGKTYFENYYGPSAPYPSVHLELIKKLIKARRPKALLDAGCGPASMLRTVKRLVPERFGFDLTPEMVEEARRILESQKDDPRRIWRGSVLDKRSYRSARSREFHPYPMVLCSGVLPHVPPSDDMRVFRNLFASVSRGGTAVIEARNQLFSLFSLNRYSHEFFLQELVRLSELKTKSKKVRQAASRLSAEMESGFRMDLPPVRTGTSGEPGYDEVLSRLHNPLVVRDQLLTAGFAKVQLRFYHYHCVPPCFADLLGDEFMKLSLAMESGTDWRGYFMASAFLAVATK